MHKTLIRVGLPYSCGGFITAARAHGYSGLVSAAAFLRGDGRIEEPWFNLAHAVNFEGMDVALDSAGFTAMRHWGGYPFEPHQYLDLAAARPWSFYASMDFCVEREIASTPIETIFRVAGTCAMFGRLCRMASERGMPPPMPVLQGATVEQYLQCVEWMPLYEWPRLVGVGSMCRRHVHGRDGVLHVVEALDKVLPKSVQLHLFGIKGTALSSLGANARVASIDSMAWEMDARRRMPVGRSMQTRLWSMHNWVGRNELIASRSAERGWFAPHDTALQELRTILANPVVFEWIEPVLNGDLGWRRAMLLCNYQLMALQSMSLSGEIEPAKADFLSCEMSHRDYQKFETGWIYDDCPV